MMVVCVMLFVFMIVVMILLFGVGVVVGCGGVFGDCEWWCDVLFDSVCVFKLSVVLCVLLV